MMNLKFFMLQSPKHSYLDVSTIWDGASLRGLIMIIKLQSFLLVASTFEKKYLKDGMKINVHFKILSASTS